MDSMPKKGRTSVFNFKENAEDIQYAPLAVEKFEDYIEDASQEQLMDFVVQEMENYRQDRIKDVSVVGDWKWRNWACKLAASLSAAGAVFNNKCPNQLAGFDRPLATRHNF